MFPVKAQRRGKFCNYSRSAIFASAQGAPACSCPSRCRYPYPQRFRCARAVLADGAAMTVAARFLRLVLSGRPE